MVLKNNLLSVAKELGSAGCYGSFDLQQENLLCLETVFSSLRFEEKVEHSRGREGGTEGGREGGKERGRNRGRERGRNRGSEKGRR